MADQDYALTSVSVPVPLNGFGQEFSQCLHRVRVPVGGFKLGQPTSRQIDAEARSHVGQTREKMVELRQRATQPMYKYQQRDGRRLGGKSVQMRVWTEESADGRVGSDGGGVGGVRRELP